MMHVVERCPSCGVEHDLSGASECEACGTRLRLWCRRHGGEMGWLAAPVCPRCADEAARAQSSGSRRAQTAVRDAPNTIRPPPAALPAQPRARPAVKRAAKREPRGCLGHLHYLVKLTLFLTTFGIVGGAAVAALTEWQSGDVVDYVVIFAQGGLVGGLCASALGAMAYGIDVLFGRRK